MSQLFASDDRITGVQLQHSPSNEYSWLISLKIDWFDLLAFQGTLRSLVQHPSLKASILWLSIFFRVQFSQPYMTTGKTIASTTQTFVGRVMSLLFNTLARFVIAFLPRSKCLLISWQQSPSAQGEEICHLFPFYLDAIMGLDAMILVFLIFSFKPALLLSSFTLIKRLFSSSLSAIRMLFIHISEVVDVSPAYLDSSL